MDGSVEKLKREREQMLAMIKAKKKMQFENTEPIAKQNSSNRSRVDFLNDRGGDIIKDLEESINDGKPKSDDGPPTPEERINADVKRVTFANESQYTESEFERTNLSQFQQQERRSTPSGSEGAKLSEQSDNKLAELNSLLKGGNFNIKEEDENEFEAFMKQLHAEKMKKKREEERQLEDFKESERELQAQQQPEAEEKANSDEQRKEEQRQFDDEMNDILNMNPGKKSNLYMFGEKEQEEQEKQVEITSITKKTATKNPSPVVVKKEETQPKSDNARLDYFMKFMENIEEEMSSQYEQSESRRESTQVPEEIMPKRTPIKQEVVASPIAPRKVDAKAATQEVMQNLTKQLAVETGDAIGTNDKYVIRQKMMELEIEKDE